MGLGENLKFTVLHDYPSNSTGSTGTTGTNYVDMQGYDGVLLLKVVTESIASAIDTVYPVLSSDYSGSTFRGCTSQYAGTAVATTAYEQMLYWVDVYRPTKRYVSCYNYKLTAASGGPVIAIQYKSKLGPVSQSTALYGCLNTKTITGLTTSA